MVGQKSEYGRVPVFRSTGCVVQHRDMLPADFLAGRQGREGGVRSKKS